MRTIKFRGKRKNWNPEYGQSEWMLGNLLNDKSIGEVGYGMDSYVYAEVIPETVGQFTGLTDKEGKEIFEGDICKNEEFDFMFVVQWWNDASAYGAFRDGEGVPFSWFSDTKDVGVIGNIHDNPELLK